jgi:cytochrome c peroxidase
MTMRSIAIIFSLLIFFAIISLSFDESKRRHPEAMLLIGRLYADDLARFDSSLKAYPKYFYDSSYSVRLKKYQELLYQYKQVECLFTYLHPKLAYENFLLTPRFQQRDFGPPIPDNWLWIAPFGIDPDSVLAKFSKKDSTSSSSFIERSVSNFRKLLAETDLKTGMFMIPEQDLFQALRLQLARISTIGLANGDMIVDAAAMPGLEGAFDSWAKMVGIYAQLLPGSAALLKEELMNKLKNGQQLLGQHTASNDFNRMDFLVNYLIPLSRQLNELQAALNIPHNNHRAAFNYQVASIYDKGAFNTDYFTPADDAYFTKARAELGKFLFFDPILSDNNQRACASCHKPAMAFADGNKTSVGFEMEKDLARNAPTVINAVFQKQQFWDLRAGSLEDQLDSVINNKDELHSSFEHVIDKVNSSEEYKNMFYAAFPDAKSKGIQRQHVKIAIASYERMLTGLDSRFDEYVRGDRSKMNAAEVNGFNLFMGKAKCGSCHFAPLFNGAFPPFYDSTEHRSLGVPAEDSMTVFKVDPDTGFSRVKAVPFNHFSFKVPTIRNVALTAPYMHNGVYKTLNQVVDFYDHAGGNKFAKEMRPGMKGVPFFMILPEKLNLTQTEKADLILFLNTLTDTTAARHVPTQLPLLGGKYARLNNRKLGGDY